MTKNRFDMKALAAFISGFCMFLAVVLPELVQYKGVMLFSGDYIAQQIPFTYRIYDGLKSFSFGWDMSAGLGGDTVHCREL